MLSFFMTAALVCIAKNEDFYVKEWVEYYAKLGFDNIHLYQNDWVCNYEHPILVKHTMNGFARQMVAYNTFLKDYRAQYDWAAFFDVDEFLVLKKHNTIKEFLSDYSGKSGVGINWYMFGNNGHTEIVNEEYSQVKRFTKRSANIDIHVKTILNCKTNYVMEVHNPSGAQIVSPTGHVFSGPFNHNGNDDIAQLNHYYYKTIEEFKLKCERGRADIANAKKSYELEYPNQLNEIEDLWAYNFLYKN